MCVTCSHLFVMYVCESTCMCILRNILLQIFAKRNDGGQNEQLLNEKTKLPSKSSNYSIWYYSYQIHHYIFQYFNASEMDAKLYQVGDIECIEGQTATNGWAQLHK